MDDESGFDRLNRYPTYDDKGNVVGFEWLSLGAYYEQIRVRANAGCPEAVELRNILFNHIFADCYHPSLYYRLFHQ